MLQLRTKAAAKNTMRGGIKTENADRMFARIQFTYDSVHDEINGPPRLAERVRDAPKPDV